MSDPTSDSIQYSAPMLPSNAPQDPEFSKEWAPGHAPEEREARERMELHALIVTFLHEINAIKHLDDEVKVSMDAVHSNLMRFVRDGKLTDEQSLALLAKTKTASQDLRADAIDKMVAIWSRNFNLAQMREIIGFYKSSIGMACIKATTEFEEGLPSICKPLITDIQDVAIEGMRDYGLNVSTTTSKFLDLLIRPLKDIIGERETEEMKADVIKKL